MAKSKKRKKKDLPKTKEEWHAQTGDDLMKHIFGPDGHELLKQQVVTNDSKTKKDYRLP